MGDEFNSGKYGAIIPLNFGIANAVTNQTVTDLAVADASGHTLYTMPKSGSIVGISICASAEVTAGSVSVRAHLASTEYAQSGYPNPTLSTAATLASYASIRPGMITFAAGAMLGVSYASATDMAPTNTNDFAVVLFVQLDPN